MSLNQIQEREVHLAIADLLGGIRRYLMKRVQVDVVEDLLQTTFLKALNSLAKSSSVPKNMAGWMYTVAKTVVIDYYRAKGVQKEFVALEEHEMPAAEWLFQESQKKDALLPDLSKCMQKLVKALPPKYKEVLWDMDIEGSSLKEISRRRGIGVSTLKSQVHRGRKMLKSKVLECCHIEMKENALVDMYPKKKNCKESC